MNGSRTLFSSVQSLSHVQLFTTPWTGAYQASLSITNSWSLLRFMSIKSVVSSNVSSSVVPFSSWLQSFTASGSLPVSQLSTSGGQSVGVSASASVLPMNIQDSFRIDWLDLLAVQGNLKSRLQHCSSKASILQHSTFFMVQLLYPYMTTGKNIV